MLSFEPNKRHLSVLLIYFFNLKKSADEAHRLLVEIEDIERSRRSKVYEDTELEAVLNQDLCQTQEEQFNGQYFE